MKKFHGLLLALIMSIMVCAATIESVISNSPKAINVVGKLRDTGDVAVRAVGRGNPFINLSDGRDIPTLYTGPAENLQALEQNLNNPATLASADFDEDGIPDLISGYTASGAGILTLHRGNEDSIYPNSPQAKQRKARGEFTDSPFLSQARVFPIPQAADFLGTGDFDGDGHRDVITAARGKKALYLMPGDGRGGFGEVTRIELTGAVTALAVGEINRVDGIADVAVGITSESGPKALIFEGSDGAMRSEPEIIALPDEAADFAMGRFNDDRFMDLAIAAGTELLIAHGRYPRVVLAQHDPAEHDPAAEELIEVVTPLSIDRRTFSYAIKSLAIGDFIGDRGPDIALWTEDGTVQALSEKKKKSNAGLKKWKRRVLDDARYSTASRLICARVSSELKDSLIVMDFANRQLRIINRSSQNPAASGNAQTSAHRASLDVEGEPLAVLPMRLNRDALSDLVVLRNGHSVPAVLVTPALATFTVTTAADSGNDGDPTVGSLREAIINANNTPGGDVIEFNIPGGTATILPPTPLPVITEAVVIDGSTDPDFAGAPVIELNGNTAGTMADGLTIAGQNVTVRGLAINRFSSNGIHIMSGSDGNIIEGNFIGTDPGGSVSLGNNAAGVFIIDANANTIGGASPSARNLISGNNNGVVLNSAGIQMSNLVQGNFIGTDVSGTMNLGNTNSGVVLSDSEFNIIGGISGAGNLISGNTQVGVNFNNTARDNLLQGNFIGTDVTGTMALGNSEGGVGIDNSSDNTIGGFMPGEGNVIAFNSAAGVAVFNGIGNAIQANSMFSNSFLGIDLGGDGVTPNDTGDVDTGPNDLQNFPVLTSATTDGANTTIMGNLNSMPMLLYRVEFFSNASCDPSGNGEGRTFIGSTMVGADCIGDAPINVMFPVVVPAGEVITATATPLDAASSTSEFSNCVTVTSSTCMITCPADVVASNDPGLCSAVVEYPPPVTSGPCGTVTCVPPSGSVFSVGMTMVTCTAMAGPACSFNVTVVDAEPPTISCPADINVPNDPGLCTAVVNYTTPATSDNCPGSETPFCDPPSGSAFPTGTTTVNCTVTDMDNSASCSFTVTVSDSQPPTIICPANVIAPNDNGSCSAVVNYPAPVVSDDCPGVRAPVCVPASGSVFPIGITNVNCTVADASGNTAECAFTVRVIDTEPPAITCSANITVPAAPGQSSAVVNYPIATATDNCPFDPAIACVPISGSTFPLGVSFVNCTANDVSGNASMCTFTVTVIDTQPPTIMCPANTTVMAPADQTSAVVNYPAPAVADNAPGAIAVCIPPSGSVFPLGVTNVTCTATDLAGNRATCGFAVTVNGGPPQIIIIIEDGTPSIQFGDSKPVRVRRKPKPNKSDCENFTITNTGFTRVVLTLDGIRRMGSDVNNGRITNPDDRSLYALSLIGANGSETTVTENTMITLERGQEADFCLRFLPVIPAVAGRSTGLAATSVIPDLVASRIDFNIAGGGTVGANISGRNATGLKLIAPDNPRTPPVVTFSKAGDEFILTYSIYDSNLDVSGARYELIDTRGAVAQVFDVDLTQALAQANLVRGQSFTVEQRFGGANDHPEIAAIRLTVSDRATSVAASASLTSQANNAIGLQSLNGVSSVKVLLNPVRLRRRYP